MQRHIDQDDTFSNEGTDWFPTEQMDLRDASSAMSRLLDSLRQETPIKAIASRIVATARHPIRSCAARIVESCSTCGCGFGAPMSLDGFQERDRVRRKSDGMEGTVDYVGSGPKGDSLSVLWDNPAQRIMGPDIVRPGTVEKT